MSLFPVLCLAWRTRGFVSLWTRKGLKSPIQSTYLINKDPENTSLLLNLHLRWATEELSFEFGLLASPLDFFWLSFEYFGLVLYGTLHQPGRPTCDVHISCLRYKTAETWKLFCRSGYDDSRRRSIAWKIVEKDNQIWRQSNPYTCALYLSEKISRKSAHSRRMEYGTGISMDYDH